MKERIRKFIKDSFFVDTVGDDDSFLANGILDSLGVMQLVTFIEREWGITVPDTDLTPANFDSISKVTAYVDSMRRTA